MQIVFIPPYDNELFIDIMKIKTSFVHSWIESKQIEFVTKPFVSIWSIITVFVALIPSVFHSLVQAKMAISSASTESATFHLVRMRISTTNCIELSWLP